MCVCPGVDLEEMPGGFRFHPGKIFGTPRWCQRLSEGGVRGSQRVPEGARGFLEVLKGLKGFQGFLASVRIILRLTKRVF